MLCKCVKTIFFRHNYVDNYVITGIQMKMSCIYKWFFYMVFLSVSPTAHEMMHCRSILQPHSVKFQIWFVLFPFGKFIENHFHVSKAKLFLFYSKILFIPTIPFLRVKLLQFSSRKAGKKHQLSIYHLFIFFDHPVMWVLVEFVSTSSNFLFPSWFRSWPPLLWTRQQCPKFSL